MWLRNKPPGGYSRYKSATGVGEGRCHNLSRLCDGLFFIELTPGSRIPVCQPPNPGIQSPGHSSHLFDHLSTTSIRIRDDEPLLFWTGLPAPPFREFLSSFRLFPRGVVFMCTIGGIFLKAKVGNGFQGGGKMHPHIFNIPRM